MYQTDVPPGEINPRGFAEEASVVKFHQKLKRLYYSCFEGDPDYDNPLIDEVRPFECTQELMMEARELVSALQRPGLWGWKDPRTPLFIDLWLALLPKVRMIIPLRHPVELFASYMRRIPNQRLMRGADQVFRSYSAYHTKILEVVEQYPEQCYIFYAQTAYQNLERLRVSLEQFLSSRLEFPESDGVFHREEFTDLSLGRAELESFARFFPAPAACFERLNQRAGIRFVGNQERPESRRGITALNGLAEFLKIPEDGADYTPLFFRVVAPTFESYSRYLARHLDDLFGKLAWLERQVASKDDAIEELKQHIQDLESAKAYFIGQLEQHKEQKQYIQDLEAAKAYFIGQLKQHEEQKKYTQELESAKAYLIGQLGQHQNTIQKQEEYIRELQTRTGAFRSLLKFRGDGE